MNKEESTKENKIKTTTLKEFLEKKPPGDFYNIDEIKSSKNYSDDINYFFTLPELLIYCNNDNCKGERFYENISPGDFYINSNGYKYGYAEYKCKNCDTTKKLYSLLAIINENNSSARLIKIGEVPPFGPPTPSKLIELIGPDREYFLLGRKCENQGLGIGAFTYYRRVVENQKNRIFDKIINVARKVGMHTDIIAELEDAKKENQFQTSVEKVKHAIPEALLIDGHNPLKLLHKALSEGVHDKSDSECLDLASSIRIVLAEISQKAAYVLKEDAEVKSALSKLINRKKK